jgi:hypothetical protein
MFLFQPVGALIGGQCPIFYGSCRLPSTSQPAKSLESLGYATFRASDLQVETAGSLDRFTRRYTFVGLRTWTKSSRLI